MPPAVSIVLPTFNRLGFLREAVASVFAQSHHDWELLVADDGSSGEAVEYLQDLARDPRVRVLFLDHTGNPAAVRNAALREARGAFIAFLDSDDFWHPAKLHQQLQAHADRPERAWSYTGLTRVDAAGAPLDPGSNWRWVPYEGRIFEELLTLRAAVATPSVMVRRELLDRIGGFDERLAFFEEYDLWLRFSVASEAIVIDSPLVSIRNHGEHYTADRDGVYRARLQLLHKVAANAVAPAVQRLIDTERAKTTLQLAAAAARSVRRGAALRELWRSRRLAANPRWWRSALHIAVRALMPQRMWALGRSIRAADRR